MSGVYHCIMSRDRLSYTWLLSREKVELELVAQFSTSLDPDDADSLQAAFVQGVRLGRADQEDMTWYRLDVYESEDGQPGRQVVRNFRWPSSLPDGRYDLGG